MAQAAAELPAQPNPPGRDVFALPTELQLRLKFATVWDKDVDASKDLVKGGWTPEQLIDARKKLRQTYVIWDLDPRIEAYIADLVRARTSLGTSTVASARRKGSKFGILETNVLVGLHEEAMMIGRAPDTFPPEWHFSSKHWRT